MESKYWIFLLLPVFYWVFAILYQIVKLIKMWLEYKLSEIKREYL